MEFAPNYTVRTVKGNVECILNRVVGDLCKLEGAFPVVRLELLFEGSCSRGAATNTAYAEAFLDEKFDDCPVSVSATAQSPSLMNGYGSGLTSQRVRSHL